MKTSHEWQILLDDNLSNGAADPFLHLAESILVQALRDCFSKKLHTFLDAVLWLEFAELPRLTLEEMDDIDPNEIDLLDVALQLPTAPRRNMFTEHRG